MPHLKFTRDKKGYEHTSLVRPARRGEGRILYWFRTPPHVKVGRSALDEEAIRLIEEHHPDITFDWPRILKAQPIVIEEPRSQKPDPRDSRKRKGQPQPRRAQEARPTPAREPVRAPEPSREPLAHAEPEPLEPIEPIEPLELLESEPAAQLQELKEPTMIEAAVQENGVSEWDAPVEAEPLGRASEEGESEGAFLSPRPIEALVGAEGLERLRARHAALLAAISEGIDDAAKREFLRSEAERLNPDNWVTIDAARAALETYESDYETVRRQLPSRRRRRRRGRRGAKNRQAHGPVAEQGNNKTSAEPPDSATSVETTEPDNGSDAPERPEDSEA